MSTKLGQRHFNNGLIAFFYSLFCSVLSILIFIGKLIISIPGRIVRLCAIICHGFKVYALRFVKGSALLKISYLFLGIREIAAKQVMRGLLRLLIEAAFCVFLLFYGLRALYDFSTLGLMVEVPAPTGGIIPGDNSMLMLLFGTATIIIIALFIGFYVSSVNAAYECEQAVRQGKKLETFSSDIKDIFDKKFYRTLLLLPLAGILIFTILPLIYMILIAFTNFNKAHMPTASLFDWVGFENFALLFNGTGQYEKLGGTFLPVLSWTLTWAFFATFTNYIGGIILALLINKKGIRGKALFRTIFVLTIAVPQFVSLLIMKNILDGLGPVNHYLLELGLIDKPLNFFGDPNNNALIPKITVLSVNLWVGIPYTMLITTGILMNIPEDLYEAAKIDGANSFTIFMRITMPYVLFVTAPYLITAFIGNINNFNLIFLLTGGGPINLDLYNAGRTDLLVTWLYKLTMEKEDYNIASVIGIITFLVSATFALISYSQSSSYKREEDFN